MTAVVTTTVAVVTRVAAQGAPRGGLTIRLVSVPDHTPLGVSIYVAGTFNNWNPEAPGFQLTSLEGGQYSITLDAAVRGPVEFKFTLGSWGAVELDSAGGEIRNRSFTVPDTGSPIYEGTVARWKDPRTSAPRVSTARPTVRVLDTAFAIPQLRRTRRVWLYLPPDYATTTKRYPVLYLQDGQNVFDAATSFAGEWGVDETLDSLQAAGDWGAIVVAIDNGGANRSNEYHPWPSEGAPFGGGEGPQYVDFIAKTLKPFIDARYRTRSDRINTGIGGSSSGGMISFYAALRYPDVFGRVLAFSPALFVNPEVFALARATRPLRPGSRFCLLSGRDEQVAGMTAPEFARAQRAMADTLAAAGFDLARDVRSRLPVDGAHAEWFWRREFPVAYRWLFSDPR